MVVENKSVADALRERLKTRGKRVVEVMVDVVLEVDIDVKKVKVLDVDKVEKDEKVKEFWNQFVEKVEFELVTTVEIIDIVESDEVLLYFFV